MNRITIIIILRQSSVSTQSACLTLSQFPSPHCSRFRHHTLCLMSHTLGMKYQGKKYNNNNNCSCNNSITWTGSDDQWVNISYVNSLSEEFVCSSCTVRIWWPVVTFDVSGQSVINDQVLCSVKFFHTVCGACRTSPRRKAPDPMWNDLKSCAIHLCKTW